MHGIPAGVCGPNVGTLVAGFLDDNHIHGLERSAEWEREQAQQCFRHVNFLFLDSCWLSPVCFSAATSQERVDALGSDLCSDVRQWAVDFFSFRACVFCCVRTLLFHGLGTGSSL